MLPYLPIKSTSFRHILWGQFSSRCDRLNLWTSSLKSMGALTESEVWNWVHWLWNCWCSFKPTAHFASKKIYPIWQSNPKNLSSPDYSALNWKLQKADNCMLKYIFCTCLLPSYIHVTSLNHVWKRDSLPGNNPNMPWLQTPTDRENRHPQGLDCSWTAPVAH